MKSLVATQMVSESGWSGGSGVLSSENNHAWRKYNLCEIKMYRSLNRPARRAAPNEQHGAMVSIVKVHRLLDEAGQDEAGRAIRSARSTRRQIQLHMSMSPMMKSECFHTKSIGKLCVGLTSVAEVRGAAWCGHRTTRFVQGTAMHRLPVSLSLAEHSSDMCGVLNYWNRTRLYDTISSIKPRLRFFLR